MGTAEEKEHRPFPGHPHYERPARLFLELLEMRKKGKQIASEGAKTKVPETRPERDVIIWHSL